MTRTTGNLLRAVLALMGVLLLVGCTSGNGDASQDGSEYRFVQAQAQGEVIPREDRKPAPDVTGELLGGQSFKLSSLKGKVVVLNFWATWCAPCRVEAPELEKIYTKYQPKGVALIGVLVRDSKDQGEVYSKQEGLTYPSIYDPKTQIALQFRNYPVVAIPSTIVFDRNGDVAAAYVSSVNATSLTETIDKLLAES